MKANVIHLDFYLSYWGCSLKCKVPPDYTRATSVFFLIHLCSCDYLHYLHFVFSFFTSHALFCTLIATLMCLYYLCLSSCCSSCLGKYKPIIYCLSRLLDGISGLSSLHVCLVWVACFLFSFWGWGGAGIAKKCSDWLRIVISRYVYDRGATRILFYFIYLI